MEVMYPQLVGFKLYPVPLGKTSKKKLEVQRAMGSKGKGKEVVVKEEDQEYQGEEDMSMYASASIPAAPCSPASVPPSAPAAAGSSSTSALSAAPIPSSTSAAPSPAVPAASASTTPTLYLSHAAYNVMKEKKGNTFEGKYPHMLRDHSGRVPLTIPGSGPWMLGEKELLSAIRILWFHIYREDYPRFCKTLATAQALADAGYHEAAEALWIKENFAIVS